MPGDGSDHPKWLLLVCDRWLGMLSSILGTHGRPQPSQCWGWEIPQESHPKATLPLTHVIMPCLMVFLWSSHVCNLCCFPSPEIFWFIALVDDLSLTTWCIFFLFSILTHSSIEFTGVRVMFFPRKWWIIPFVSWQIFLSCFPKTWY